MITYRTARTPEGVNLFVKTALKNKLFNDGWQFQIIFNSHLSGGSYRVRDITIAYADGRPVGVSISWFEHVYHCQQIGCFVKPDYRLKGIGRQLIDYTAKGDYTQSYGQGVRGSGIFFAKTYDAKKNQSLIAA